MRRTIPALVLLALAGPAAAGPEDKQFVARRLAADHHLQIEVKGVDVPAEAVGLCKVEGLAVRVFKSAGGRFHPGSGLAFFQPCATRPATAHSGETLWPAETLRSAKVVEVFLRPGRAGLETADGGQGLKLLDGPTDTPAVRDDPALVREMRQTIASYEIETALKRNDTNAALALARDEDMGVRARLLAQVAAGLASRPAGKDVLDEAAKVLAGLPAGEVRLAAAMDMGETLVLAGAAGPALGIAVVTQAELAGVTERARRDEVLLHLFGLKLRAGEPAGALAALAQVSDGMVRRDRLDEAPYALKGFAANPASPDFMAKLLAAADALPPERRGEAVEHLAAAAHKAAGTLEPAQAARVVEPGAVRRHTPSATVMAVLSEMGEGLAKDRAQAARWYAVAAAGFGGSDAERADAKRRLAGFTPAERGAAARLLGAGPVAQATVEKLVDLATK
ncbi:MAG: hypothetical protein ACM31L_08130 [Actinomycetota bacterium]